MTVCLSDTCVRCGFVPINVRQLSKIQGSDDDLSPEDCEAVKGAWKQGGLVN